MTTYKYSSDSVVAKIDDDGLSRLSCSIEHPEFVAWFADGNTPEPADVVPWSPDPLLNKMRAARPYALNALIGIITTEREADVPDQMLIAACLAARVSLLGITDLPAVKNATNDASLGLALVQAYGAIVYAAPEAIRNAFAGLNQ